MSRLDDYRTAMLAAHVDAGADELTRALDMRDADFAAFIVDHGLGPLWHERTGRDEFRASRLAAEALFLAQERALHKIDAALGAIDHTLIKGAANRLLLYGNPAARACFDLDLLVRFDDRVRAALALSELGFQAFPEAQSISRELVLAHQGVDVDLHWGLLREGRLRVDLTGEMLGRRRRVGDAWTLDIQDALFVLLVHPAFAKHLAGWDMGLHRVADILAFLRTQAIDWVPLKQLLDRSGVRTAAWATLRWCELLAGTHAPPALAEGLAELEPGSLRRAWLGRWLRSDLPARTAGVHWARLAGFSVFLHDRPGDALRAVRGRRAAARRSGEDLAAFAGLLGE